MFNLNDRMIPFAIAATLSTVVFIFFMITMLVVFGKRQAQKKKQYFEAIIAEREATMCAISMELHDNLTQMLNLARMTTHFVSDSVTEEGLPLIKKLGEMLDVLIVDSQNISHSLNADYLKQKGLIRSLQEEVSWVNASCKINCKLEINGTVKKLPDQSKIMVFRIIQEAINNVLKYAMAKNLLIMLEFKNKDFRAYVKDDGKGFNVEDKQLNKGVGMISMKQRAKMVNGTLDIWSAEHAGTQISLYIPDAF